MFEEENVSLCCPYCGGDIEKPLSFFRKTYSTCPLCGRGLSAGQFATLVDSLDVAFDAGIEEMVRGEGSGCGCSREGCCGKDQRKTL